MPPPLTPHPDFARLYQVLARNQDALLQAWTGRAFRAALPRWMSRPYRWTGAGAMLRGGRWSGPSLMPTVYFSLEAQTLAVEADAMAIRYGWKPEWMRPQMRIVAEIRLTRLLNLTDPGVLRELKLKTEDLTNCDWGSAQTNGREPLTQAVGRAAFEHLAEGLIVPSARRAKGSNLVYYPCHRQDGTQIHTLNENEIPLMHGW